VHQDQGPDQRREDLHRHLPTQRQQQYLHPHLRCPSHHLNNSKVKGKAMFNPTHSNSHSSPRALSISPSSMDSILRVKDRGKAKAVTRGVAVDLEDLPGELKEAIEAPAEGAAGAATTRVLLKTHHPTMPRDPLVLIASSTGANRGQSSIMRCTVRACSLRATVRQCSHMEADP